MATHWALEDFQNGYVELVDYVVEHGTPVAPRGIPTLEIHDMQLIVKNPLRSAPVGVGRRLPLGIVAAETMQLIGGISDLAQLDAVSGGNFSQFSDDGMRLGGAYGPRIHQQLKGTVARLAKDRDSRQACVTIWREMDGENDYMGKDVPCTMGFMFDVRDDRLNMTVTMRSSDVWLGMPIDVPVFTRLQAAIALALDVEMGTYVHHSRSLHLYERDLEAAGQLKTTLEPPPQPPFIEATRGLIGPDPNERWYQISKAAEDAALYQVKWGGGGGDWLDLSWFVDHLPASGSDRRLCESCRYVLPTYNDGRGRVRDHQCLM